MTKQEFEDNLIRVASIQREAGWSENSIKLYEKEMRYLNPEEHLGSVLMIGAGLACNNERFGVFK